MMVPSSLLYSTVTCTVCEGSLCKFQSEGEKANDDEFDSV